MLVQPIVKIIRILLLALLVMVLPLRGALAGGDHCASASDVQTSGLSVSAEHSGHGQMGHDGPVADANDLKDPCDDLCAEAGSPDNCKYCSAFCSGSPLVNVQPPVIEFITLADTSFPALIAPLPSHLSEVQDRPPQSS